MIPKDKRTVTVGVITAVLAALIIFVGTYARAQVASAFASKESITDHRRDMDAVGAKVDRVLDLLCADSTHVNARQCKE